MKFINPKGVEFEYLESFSEVKRDSFPFGSIYEKEDLTGKKLLAKFWWYEDRPIGESGKVPANPTTAPIPATKARINPTSGRANREVYSFGNIVVSM